MPGARECLLPNPDCGYPLRKKACFSDIFLPCLTEISSTCKTDVVHSTPLWTVLFSCNYFHTATWYIQIRLHVFPALRFEPRTLCMLNTCSVIELHSCWKALLAGQGYNLSWLAAFVKTLVTWKLPPSSKASCFYLLLSGGWPWAWRTEQKPDLSSDSSLAQVPATKLC